MDMLLKSSNTSLKRCAAILKSSKNSSSVSITMVINCLPRRLQDLISLKEHCITVYKTESPSLVLRQHDRVARLMRTTEQNLMSIITGNQRCTSVGSRTGIQPALTGKSRVSVGSIHDSH